MRKRVERITRHGAPSRPGGFDHQSFCAHLKESYRVLWLIAVGTVGDSSRAEDVLQESAMIALGKLNEFEPGTNFAAWMGQMVRFVGLNMVRKDRKRRATGWSEHDPDIEQVSLRGAETESRSSEAAFDHRIERALAEVADIPRACLLLRTIEGMPYTQISELLEIPEGTAMSHVHRTRRYLRERLAAFQPDRAAPKEPPA